MLMFAEFDYLGPFIHGIAEYRIKWEIGYINKKYDIVDGKGNCLKKNN